MVIGIVSKPEHAKAHAAVLEAEGHTVKILGARPVDFPDTLEALILRWQSSSHPGLERARAWAKKNKVPIIHENGVSGILSVLSKIQGEKVEPVIAQENIVQSLDSQIVDALNGGKIDGRLRFDLAHLAATPARFVLRCLEAVEAENSSTIGQSGVLLVNRDVLRLFGRLFPSVEAISEAKFKWFTDACNTIHALSLDEREALRSHFMAGDAKGHGFFPTPLPPLVESFKSRSSAFLAFYMCLLADLRPKRKSIATNAYKELTTSQCDPKAFKVFCDLFGFEMDFVRSYRPSLTTETPPARPAEARAAEEPPAHLPVVVEPPASPVVAYNVEAALRGVQDLLIDLAIRVEDLQKTCAALNERVEVTSNPNPLVVKTEASIEDCLTRLKSLGATVTIQIGSTT